MPENSNGNDGAGAGAGAAGLVSTVGLVVSGRARVVSCAATVTAVDRNSPVSESGSDRSRRIRESRGFEAVRGSALPLRRYTTGVLSRTCDSMVTHASHRESDRASFAGSGLQ